MAAAWYYQGPDGGVFIAVLCLFCAVSAVGVVRCWLLKARGATAVEVASANAVTSSLCFLVVLAYDFALMAARFRHLTRTVYVHAAVDGVDVWPVRDFVVREGANRHRVAGRFDAPSCGFTLTAPVNVTAAVFSGICDTIAVGPPHTRRGNVVASTFERVGVAFGLVVYAALQLAVLCTTISFDLAAAKELDRAGGSGGGSVTPWSRLRAARWAIGGWLLCTALGGQQALVLLPLTSAQGSRDCFSFFLPPRMTPFTAMCLHQAAIACLPAGLALALLAAALWLCSRASAKGVKGGAALACVLCGVVPAVVLAVAAAAMLLFYLLGGIVVGTYMQWASFWPNVVVNVNNAIQGSVFVVMHAVAAVDVAGVLCGCCLRCAGTSPVAASVCCLGRGATTSSSAMVPAASAGSRASYKAARAASTVVRGAGDAVVQPLQQHERHSSSTARLNSSSSLRLHSVGTVAV